MPVQKIRPVNLSELYSKLQRDSGLAPRTVGHAHRILHRALGHALPWGIVPTNIVGSVQPPKAESTEIEILKPADVQTVLAKLAGRAIHPHAVTDLAAAIRRRATL